MVLFDILKDKESFGVLTDTWGSSFGFKNGKHWLW